MLLVNKHTTFLIQFEINLHSFFKKYFLKNSLVEFNSKLQKLSRVLFCKSYHEQSSESHCFMQNVTLSCLRNNSGRESLSKSRDFTARNGYQLRNISHTCTVWLDIVNPI